jgi:uncharacterized protein (TIGR00369 family)
MASPRRNGFKPSPAKSCSKPSPKGRLPQPPIAQHNTFWLVEIGDGTATFEGETGPHLCNPAGTVHGGWALTMIDSATACAAHSLLPAGVGYTTLETKANFTRAISPSTGRVRCEGRVVSPGRQIISADDASAGSGAVLGPARGGGKGGVNQTHVRVRLRVIPP